MSLTIVRRRERVTETFYELSFESKSTPGAGYSFPCDFMGRLLDDGDGRWDAIIKELRTNIDYEQVGVVERKSYHIEPALGHCQCGAEVVLWDPLDNECEKCHRWYNICGQQVVDPDSELGKALRAEDDRFADDN